MYNPDTNNDPDNPWRVMADGLVFSRHATEEEGQSGLEEAKALYSHAAAEYREQARKLMLKAKGTEEACETLRLRLV